MSASERTGALARGNQRHQCFARLLMLSGTFLVVSFCQLQPAFTAGNRAISARGFQRVARKSAALPDIRTEARGDEGTESFRRYFMNEEGKEISPWHDLPLRPQDAGDAEYWMVTEIPKMTRAKMEIATKEPANPIAQDKKKGKLRDYHGPIFWNYGYLPQTWEDPSVEHPKLKVLGDNDPVDVVEIGSRAHAQGEVVRVKILGALAMIDDGELDWKVLAIAADDPLASQLNDVADIDKHMKGVISGVREWFRWYKTPDGKPLNEFGYDEAALGRDQAAEVIKETHGFWQKLRSGSAEAKGLWTGDKQPAPA